MHIDQELLTTWGGVYKTYDKHDHIFMESEHPRYYYQIVEGSIKMYNSNEAGKEYIQGVFGPGQSFGEPVLFINEPYPASAVCTQKTILLRISLENFHKILAEYPELLKRFVILFANRIYSKSITAREIANNNPEHRILAFLNSYKKQHVETKGKILIPYTRQEIANFTGLRVETVIRTLLKIQKSNKIEIRQPKLYY